MKRVYGTIALVFYLAPVLLAVVSIVHLLALNLKILYPPVVVPVSLAIGFAICWIVGRKIYGFILAKNRGEKVADGVALIFIALWLVVNMFMTSQNIFTDRDPAVYTNTALWLSSSKSLDIETSELVQGLDYASGGSAGFYELKDGHTIEAHGQHLLPALAGSLGAIAGHQALFKVNILIGAIALMALYAISRRVVSPVLSVGALVVVALSVPMVYFSRDMYTEPLSMAFILSGLSFAILLGKHPRAEGSKKYLLVSLLGFVFGSALMVRVDAGMAIIGLLLIMAYMRATGLVRGGHMVALGVAIALPALLGAMDLYLHSPVYLKSHLSQISLQYMGVALALLCMLSMLSEKVQGWTKKLAGFLARYSSVVMVVLASLFTILALRPLFMRSLGRGENAYVDSIRGFYDLPGGDFTYTEHSLSWIAWYIGEPLAILGVIGLVILVISMLKFNKPSVQAAVIALPLLASLIYIIRPSITPDQVWAMRRFMPVIIPLLVVSGFMVVDRYMRLREKASDSSSKKDAIGKVLPFMAVAILCIPILLAGRVSLIHRGLLQYSSIAEMCRVLPENATVLWAGLGRLEAVMPTRAICGVDSANFNDATSDAPDNPDNYHLEDFSYRARQVGKVPYVAYFKENAYVMEAVDTGSAVRVSERDFSQIRPTIYGAPVSISHTDSAIYLMKLE